MKGSTIKWIDPLNFGCVLIHPGFIAAHVAAEKKMAELEKLGFKKTADAAAIIGINDSVVAVRARHLVGDKIYGLDGLPPKGTPGERTLKGSELKWVHPYNSHIIMLHPKYIKAQQQAEADYGALIKKNYRRPFEGGRSLGNRIGGFANADPLP
ncbi:MAG: hypothetical protein WDN72_09240 [Alphaproteobacteria bacterium]